MSKIDKVMTTAIDSIDSIHDRLQIAKAKVLLGISAKLLAVCYRLFNRMTAYATEMIEAGYEKDM